MFSRDCDFFYGLGFLDGRNRSFFHRKWLFSEIAGSRKFSNWIHGSRIRIGFFTSRRVLIQSQHSTRISLCLRSPKENKEILSLPADSFCCWLLHLLRTGRSSAAEVSSKLAVEAFVLVVSECSTKLAVSPASVALDALLFELAFETVDAFEAALDFELTEVIELSEAVLLRLEAAEIVLSSSEIIKR